MLNHLRGYETYISPLLLRHLLMQDIYFEYSDIHFKAKCIYQLLSKYFIMKFYRSTFQDNLKLHKCSIIAKTYGMSLDNKTCYFTYNLKVCDRQCRHKNTWRHE